MKWHYLALLTTLSITSAVTSFAEETPNPLQADPDDIELVLPTQERAFVDAIGKSDKKKIIAQFGEPAKADDVKIKGSGKIVASIWHYHHINTAEDGTYYETTELDFIEDKVVQVVFLNNDGTEKDPQGQTYEIQPNAPLENTTPMDAMPPEEALPPIE